MAIRESKANDLIDILEEIATKCERLSMRKRTAEQYRNGIIEITDHIIDIINALDG